MKPARPTPEQSGFTLLELLVVSAILGIITGFAVPRFGLAFEQARTDEASARLESIWRAQRLHHLEYGEPSDTLERLALLRLIDGGIVEATTPFSYALGASLWAAEATRNGSRTWRGVLDIDARGELGGRVHDGSGTYVRPPAN